MRRDENCVGKVCSGISVVVVVKEEEGGQEHLVPLGAWSIVREIRVAIEWVVEERSATHQARGKMTVPNSRGPGGFGRGGGPAEDAGMNPPLRTPPLPPAPAPAFAHPVAAAAATANGRRRGGAAAAVAVRTGRCDYPGRPSRGPSQPSWRWRGLEVLVRAPHVERGGRESRGGTVNEGFGAMFSRGPPEGSNR
ncbi:hypothetical protein LZ30DRAFT_303532 [Colletotrichum cereale]|nr:hypothetical protein LZ30DRAFT_303532 [Colletotrichum cereale]